ncbi:MAG: hypothetical protein AAGM67_00255 [Bacteroidota bacterium]
MYEIPEWINEENLKSVREEIDIHTLSDAFEKLVSQIFDDKKFMRYVLFEILEAWHAFRCSEEKPLPTIPTVLLPLYRELLEKDVSEYALHLFFRGYADVHHHAARRLTILKSARFITEFFIEYYRVKDHDSFFQCWCLLHIAETMKMYASCGERFFSLWRDNHLPYERATNPPYPWIQSYIQPHVKKPLPKAQEDTGLQLYWSSKPERPEVGAVYLNTQLGSMEIFDGEQWLPIAANES